MVQNSPERDDKSIPRSLNGADPGGVLRPGVLLSPGILISPSVRRHTSRQGGSAPVDRLVPAPE